MASPSGPSPILPAELAALLECPICVVKYNDGDNKPVFLDCGHTTCKACHHQLTVPRVQQPLLLPLLLHELIWEEREDGFACPVCGEQHTSGRAIVNRDILAFSEFFNRPAPAENRPVAAIASVAHHLGVDENQQAAVFAETVNRPDPAQKEGPKCIDCNRAVKLVTCMLVGCAGKAKPFCTDCFRRGHDTHGFDFYKDTEKEDPPAPQESALAALLRDLNF